MPPPRVDGYNPSRMTDLILTENTDVFRLYQTCFVLVHPYITICGGGCNNGYFVDRSKALFKGHYHQPTPKPTPTNGSTTPLSTTSLHHSTPPHFPISHFKPPHNVFHPTALSTTQNRNSRCTYYLETTAEPNPRHSKNHPETDFPETNLRTKTPPNLNPTSPRKHADAASPTRPLKRHFG